MALQKFLVDLDLAGNKLMRASLEHAAADPAVVTTGQMYYNTTDNVIKYHDGTQWRNINSDVDTYVTIQPGNNITVDNTDPLNPIVGTVENPTFTAVNATVVNATTINGDVVGDVTGNADTATALANARNFAISGQVTAPSVSFDGTGDVNLNASIATNYVETVTAGDANIEVTTTGTDFNKDVTVGLAGDITVDTINQGGEALTIGATDSDVTIQGNLTVNGTQNIINSNEVQIGDAIITLNADLPANQAPSEDSGIQVNRGNEEDATLLWNETTDEWQANGDTIVTVGNMGDVVAIDSTQVTDFIDAAQDAVGNALVDTNSIDLTYDDVASSITADLRFVETYLDMTANGLDVDIDAIANQITGGGGTAAVKATYDIVGDGSATTFSGAHPFGSANVTSELIDTTTGGRAYADVVTTSTNWAVTTNNPLPVGENYKLVLVG